MKIMHFIPNLLIGGAESFVVDLVNKLSEKNEVILVLFYSEKLIPGQIFLNNISKRVRIIFLEKKLGLDFSLFKKIRNLIKREDPDIIHTHIRSFNYVYATKLFMKSKAKGFHTVHSDAFKEGGTILERYFKRYIFKTKVAYPIVISKKSLESFNECYPGIECTLIENGRKVAKESLEFEKVKEEINSYKQDANTRVLLYIGRIVYAKNLLLLLKSFSKLAVHKNIILVIIGHMCDYSETAEIKSLIDANDKIFYVGSKSNVADYLSVSDYVCFSSRWEGMPITLIEAFAKGVIPIVTPVGGMSDMVGNDGFVSKDLTLEEYCTTMETALSLSMQERNSIKERLKEKYKTYYTMDKCAAKYEQIYEWRLSYN